MQLTKAVAALAPVLVACSGSPTNTVPVGAYIETKLVADTAGLGAASLDSNLVNPWGLAFGPTGILWVSNNHSGTSTLYDTTGAKRPLVVAIPSSGSATGGAPTGIIYNPTSDFVIPGAGKALFIFAGEDGTISAWNSGTGDARLVTAHRAAQCTRPSRWPQTEARTFCSPRTSSRTRWMCSTRRFSS